MPALFREAGFEAATVPEEKLSGADDSVLFDRCRAEDRVLVTWIWISPTSKLILLGPIRES
jgi:hypothetical protein